MRRETMSSWHSWLIVHLDTSTPKWEHISCLCMVYCRTEFGSDGLTAARIATKDALSLEFVTEIIPNIPYIGVVFPFMGSLSLDRNNFSFAMILTETLTFLLLYDPVNP